MDEKIVTILAFVTGWVLDLVFGDPEKLPHPVVYMGKWISWFEHRLNRGNLRVLKGAIFAVFSVLLTYFGVGFLITSPVLLIQDEKMVLAYWFVVQSIFVFFCLAGHTLRKEVRMVFDAGEESLEKARAQVQRIVGRDTSELSMQEVRKAALETLAENLSDGVVAPIFWFLLLGVPGMMMYKMINTMDSMIGYRDQKYKDFGCWAARIDDVANYIPARITALVIVVSASLLERKKQFGQMARFVIKYGSNHLSPNSGWPESALAAVLDCCFGGPHYYFGKLVYKPLIGDNDRKIEFEDMKSSCRVCFLAEVIVVAIVVLYYTFPFINKIGELFMFMIIACFN